MGEIVTFILGVVIGFLFGITIYWLPIGQFWNELRALLSLISKRYPEGTEILVRGGIDLKPLDTNLRVQYAIKEQLMKVSLDEGINWHHTQSGWIRARVLQVWKDEREDVIPALYRICERDILERK